MNLDMIELHELFKKRDQMIHEIGLLLEDIQTIREIGYKTFIEYENEVLKPVIKMFDFKYRDVAKVWTFRGHKLSLIRYYCDSFNTRSEDE